MITKKTLKTTLIVLLALYAAIFAARLAYEIVTYEDSGSSYRYNPLSNSYADYETRSTSNFASFRKEYAVDMSGSVQVLEQKYEQVATVSAKTVSFDEDLNNLNKAVEQAQAVVQKEYSQGLPGNRTVTQVIGVKPQYFESCLEAVKNVGTLVSSTLQKNDKTYEYRQMLAQKQELEKRLESYQALREHNGSINEMLNLEDKIIDVESMLLQQAVDLGEYSDDNALCTINFTLNEGNVMNVGNIVWSAFTWASACYFGILGGAVFICVAAAILIKLFTFFSKIFNSVVKKKLLKDE